MRQILLNRISFQRTNFVFFSLILSFFIHLLVFSSFFLFIDGSANPVIFSWPGILNKNDFFIEKKQIPLPPGVNFLLPNLDKDYFLSSFVTAELPYFLKKDEAPVFYNHEEASLDKSSLREETDYLYLWEKSAGLSDWDKEAISYKVLVSPHGKVILSFPEKLPFNSYGNLIAQEYVRESVLFLKEKFFWTKLEGIVQ